jgi:hypothetical protein
MSIWGHHTYLYKPKANYAWSGEQMVIERPIPYVRMN